MPGLGWPGSWPFAGKRTPYWPDELEVPVGHTIEIRTGPVRASRKATTSLSSQLAIPGLGPVSWIMERGQAVQSPLPHQLPGMKPGQGTAVGKAPSSR